MKKKDKLSATLLSVFFPGTAQFYLGNGVKGFLIFILSPILILPWIYGIIDARSECDRVNSGEKPFAEPAFNHLRAYFYLIFFSVLVIQAFLLFSNNNLIQQILYIGYPLYMILSFYFPAILLLIGQIYLLKHKSTLLPALICTLAAIILMGMVSFVLGGIETFNAMATVDPALKHLLMAQGISISLYGLAFSTLISIPLILITGQLITIKRLIHK